MERPGRLRIALVGLGFGSTFVPIYAEHPDVEFVGIVDPDPEVLERVGNAFDIERRHSELAEVLKKG